MAVHENPASHHAIRTSSDRSFGLVSAGVLVLIAAYWWQHGSGWPSMAVVAAVGFAAVALTFPSLLAVPNRLWTKLGLAIGAVVAPVVMGLVFFLVVTPLGLIGRVAGKQFLQLRRNDKAGSYWVPREEQTTSPERLRDQF